MVKAKKVSTKKKTKNSNDVIAVIEGRLIEQNEKTIKIEISNGNIINVSGGNFKKIKQIEDKKNSRPFVEVNVSRNNLLNLEIKPQFLLDVMKSNKLPFAFASHEGMAFSVGQNTSLTKTKSKLKNVTDVIFPLMETTAEGTRCIMMCCKRYVPTPWGRVCMEETADINRLDDQ